MTLLHNFRTAFLAVALLGGCASDAQIQKPSQTDDDDGSEDDDDDDDSASKKDGGKDAGKKDAGKKDSGSSGDDDEGDDVDDDDSELVDAGKDAGKGDAGKDAGKSDGGASDAGRSDAGRSDAGSSAACTNLTYETFGANFIDSYCALCHNTGSAANGNVALNSLAGIVARKEAVKAAVLTERMPPSNPLFAAPSETERERFGAFIDCGPR